MKKLFKKLALMVVALLTFSVGSNYTVKEVKAAEVTATITFNNTSKRTVFTTSQQVWVENGITVTNNKASSTSNVGDYSNPARFYKSSNLVIDFTSEIIKIAFTASSSSYATALANSIKSGATVTSSGTLVTAVLNTPASSFTIDAMSAQVRVSSLTITSDDSAGGETPEPEEPVTPSLSAVTGFNYSNGTISWNAVENAVSYILTIKNSLGETIVAGYETLLTSYSVSGYDYNSYTVDIYAKGDNINYLDSSVTIYNFTIEPTYMTSMSSFTSVNDNIGGDTNVSYSTAQGGGTTAPAIYDNQIRIYQAGSGKTEGGSITIYTASGYLLKDVSIGSSMGTSIAYTIGDDKKKSESISLLANSKYVVSNIESTKITFYCMSTNKNLRLVVNFLGVNYEETTSLNDIIGSYKTQTSLKFNYDETSRTNSGASSNYTIDYKHELFTWEKSGNYNDEKYYNNNPYLYFSEGASFIKNESYFKENNITNVSELTINTGSYNGKNINGVLRLSFIDENSSILLEKEIFNLSGDATIETESSYIVTIEELEKETIKDATGLLITANIEKGNVKLFSISLNCDYDIKSYSYSNFSDFSLRFNSESIPTDAWSSFGEVTDFGFEIKTTGEYIKYSVKTNNGSLATDTEGNVSFALVLNLGDLTYDQLMTKFYARAYVVIGSQTYYLQVNQYNEVDGISISEMVDHYLDNYNVSTLSQYAVIESLDSYIEGLKTAL